MNKRSYHRLLVAAVLMGCVPQAVAQVNPATMPKAVEKAAYVYGRCYMFLTHTVQQQANTMIQGKGFLLKTFNLGVAESRKNPPTLQFCQTNVNNIRLELERYFKGGG